MTITSLSRIVFLLAIATALLLSFMNASPERSWKAPPEADKLKNPFENDTEAWKKAEATFQTLCMICHGEKGHGDGIAGMALTPRPANLTSEDVQKQTDGAIFWKITNGNPPMASYKETLSEEQRWQLVKYIRRLGSE
ncbi:MAG TPA: cytochrome c [Caldithrix abyssi]|uniref:Cytochrome c n=1 Tax=Caldithrix abyssi TaxID=187145 RepID=A0A7V4U0F0_CALAY|nr:cytochrome c [Caldithrix abyssi]